VPPGPRTGNERDASGIAVPPGPRTGNERDASGIAVPPGPRRAGAPVLRHGPTYAGHPACCAAANVALDIYEREALIERGRTLEEPLAAALAPLAEHPLVGEVRAGLGFMAGIDLAPDALAADPGLVVAWQKACRVAGVLVRPLGRGIAVSPPLTCGQEEIELLADGIADGLDRVAARGRAIDFAIKP
jgi:putrescine---pyruvate transaminase